MNIAVILCLISPHSNTEGWNFQYSTTFLSFRSFIHSPPILRALL